MDKRSSESSFSEVEPADEEVIVVTKPVVVKQESISPAMSSSASDVMFSPYEEPVDPVMIKSEPISQEIVEKMLSPDEIKKELPSPEASGGEIFIKQELPSPEKHIKAEPLTPIKHIKTEPVSPGRDIKVEPTTLVNLTQEPEKRPCLGAIPKVEVKREQVLVYVEPTRKQENDPPAVGSHDEVLCIEPQKISPKTEAADITKEDEIEFSNGPDLITSSPNATINADQADIIEVVGEDTPLIVGRSAPRKSRCLKFFDWMTGYCGAIARSDKWFFASNCLIIWIFVFIVITVCALASTPKTASTISVYLVVTFSLGIVFVSALLYLCYRRISYRDNQESTRIHRTA